MRLSKFPGRIPCSVRPLNLAYEQWQLADDHGPPGWEHVIDCVDRLKAKQPDATIWILGRGIIDKCYREMATMRVSELEGGRTVFTNYIWAHRLRGKLGLIRASTIRRDTILWRHYRQLSHGMVADTSASEVFAGPVEWPRDATLTGDEEFLLFWHDADVVFRLWAVPPAH